MTTTILHAQTLTDWHCHNVTADFLAALERHDALMDENFPMPKWSAVEHLAFMDASNLKHWNGAAANDSCTLVTVTEKSEKGHIEWFEKVEESSILPVVVDADNMLIRISEIEVYPQYLDEYLTFAKNVGAESVAKEPGVVCIYPMIQQRDKHQIRILEIYRDQEAYQHHIQTEHFQTYKQGTLHMVKSLDLVDMNPMNADGMLNIFKKM